jgi:hypothetical protein
VSQVPAVDQNRYHLSIANLAQFGAKIGIRKFFLFVLGENQKSGEDLMNDPVAVQPCLQMCTQLYRSTAVP